MTRRVLTVAAAGLLGLGLLAPANGQAAERATTSSTASVASVTASSEDLNWGRCGAAFPRRARCATLVVPRDWAAPRQAETYRIRVIRISAPADSRIGVLTYNTGGPGGTGVSSFPNVYGTLPASIRQHFDIVGWDPRGTGRSDPRLRGCTFDEARPPTTGPVNWADYTNDFYAKQAADAEACLERNAVDAGYVGTWQVIRDLDALRAALGERQISFWGMSYGTTIGRAYAQAFPMRVRALVLDGTISPAPSIASYSREHIWDDVTAIDTMLGALGPSRVRTYDRAMRYLDRRTLAMPGGQRLTRWEFGGRLVSAAAYQQAWSDVGDFLDLVRRRLDRAASPSDVRRMAEVFTELPADDPYLLRRGGMNPQYFYVNCSDMPDRPSPEALARTAEQAADVGGVVMGLAVLGEGAQCAGLPTIGRALPGLRTILRLATPPIVVNSVADNRTPWLGARQTANVFAGSVMVSYAGTQHVAYGRVSGCINRPVTTFLLTLQRPARSVACPLVWG